jgi:hypothetical protein
MIDRLFVFRQEVTRRRNAISEHLDSNWETDFFVLVETSTMCLNVQVKFQSM